MTIKDIRTIMALASSTANKIYTAIDDAGQIRYWIGLGNGRLREISASEAQSIQDKNRTTTSTGSTTTTPTRTPSTSTSSGCTVDFVAVNTIAAFILVTSDGQPASSATTSHRNKVIGISTTAVGVGFAGTAAACGEIVNPLWAWTIGDKIFLNGTALSTTAPSTGFSQMIGTAVATDTIEVNLQPAILL